MSTEVKDVKEVKWMCDSCCEEFTGSSEEHCPFCQSHKIFKI
jgi:rubrerythrin